MTKNPKFILYLFLIIFLLQGCGNNKVETNSNVKSNANIDTGSLPSIKINSGLLIGLSKDNEIGQDKNIMQRVPNDYRTLWIYQDNGKLTYLEKEGLITPYQDGFYKLSNSKFTMATPKSNGGNNSDSIFQKYESYYNFSEIASNMADKHDNQLITEETFKKNILQDNPWGFRSQVEWLWYVGNKYVCVMSNYFETGGGSYHSRGDNFKVYNISDLTGLEGRKKSIALADLLDDSERAKLQEYHQKYDKIISSDNRLVEEKQQIDTKNILLTRKEGGWQVILPLYDIFQHNGNGSYGHSIKDYIPVDIKLPKIITSYDALCYSWDFIKQKIPQAEDAVCSPNDDMLAVLTPNKLLIYANPKKGIESPSLSIDVDKNESIILNQWATGDYVNKWSELLNKY